MHVTVNVGDVFCTPVLEVTRTPAILHGGWAVGTGAVILLGALLRTLLWALSVALLSAHLGTLLRSLLVGALLRHQLNV